MTRKEYWENTSPLDCPEVPFLVVEEQEPLDLRDLMEYMEAYPQKIFRYLDNHLADDTLRSFVNDFYEYACEPDDDGPDFEKWRTS